MSSQYAQIADLFRHGLPPAARGNLTDAMLSAALVSASVVADSYLNGRYKLPLLAWSDDITMYVCWMAAYQLLSGPRGNAAGDGFDTNLEARNAFAVQWFRGVQSKNTHPLVTESPGASPTYDQPFVISSSVVTAGGRVATTRGW